MAASAGHLNGTRKASLAFGSVVTEELVAMLAAPFAEVVVASMRFDGKGDDFFAKRRVKALLQVEEYLRKAMPGSMWTAANETSTAKTP